mgnify:CR=1 FL=1
MSARETSIPPLVVFEDTEVLVVHKPAGWNTHAPSPYANEGIYEWLRHREPRWARLAILHRLDKETSGVLLLAKKRSALTALQAQFRARGTAKVYAALVFGAWPGHLKVIDEPLHKSLAADGQRHVRVVSKASDDGRRSITLVRVRRAFAEATLLDVSIKTGRTHQIRVHLAHAGHPVVGDPKYGDFERNKAFAKAQRFARMFLHASELGFDHPADGRRIVLRSPLPAECATLLGALAR